MQWHLDLWCLVMGSSLSASRQNSLISENYPHQLSISLSDWKLHRRHTPLQCIGSFELIRRVNILSYHDQSPSKASDPLDHLKHPIYLAIVPNKLKILSVNGGRHFSNWNLKKKKTWWLFFGTMKNEHDNDDFLWIKIYKDNHDHSARFVNFMY